MKPQILPVLLVFLAVLCAPFAGLAEDQKSSTVNTAADQIQQPSAMSFLPGRIWQLVEIVSMDDRVEVPDDPTLYTVEFKTDGTAQIRADCNRGSGSWTSTAAGQLQFGPIASTRAMCPPGSLHDRYLAQFPWVRSYVEKGDHLFMATMADGSIIEFEPIELPLAATVLGEDIRTSDAREMQEILLTRLFDRYAEEQGIEVKDEEIDAFVETMQHGMGAMGLTAEADLSDQDKAQVAQMRRDMGRALIRQWQVNRALYRHYGGRIIYQQFGPEPLDAYLQYLEERRDAGDFTINQKAFEERFWHYFTTDSIHDFYPPGSKEASQAFATPPWEEGAASAETPSQHALAGDVPAAPEDGGPLNWQVSGASGGLNLRAEPSTSATRVASYPDGTILDNLGCRRAENRVWCDVQQFGGGPRGYVAAEYLIPAVSPNGAAIMGPDDSALRAGQGDFDATGPIPCAQYRGQPMGSCEFGVARTGGGYATVVITRFDGTKRAVYFRMGVAVGADTSQADGYPEFKATKESGLYMIRVGDERYEIPEAVIFGG
ncbi:MAG: META domain-containing protein [Desulfofustis sp.]|nr:META domain-containing protein [Desulfofustis sp.]